MADAILKVIATGAPYMICCAARGLAYDSFMTWKREDLEFAARVEEASAKAALRLLSKIEKQAGLKLLCNIPLAEYYTNLRSTLDWRPDFGFPWQVPRFWILDTVRLGGVSAE